MNSQHRAIRILLQEMGPRRAESYIQAFDLRDNESMYIIEREVRRKSIQQIASAHTVSAETVKRRRRSGFQKIAEQINHSSTISAAMMQ